MVRVNIRRGLLRGWLVLAVVWLFSVSVFFAWKIVGEPACFVFNSITLNGDYKGEYAVNVKDLREKLLSTPSFCGAQISLDLLTLESYAKYKAISQVSFAWKEPNGWSTETRAMLDILEGREITASRITEDMTKFTRESRLRDQSPLFFTMVTIPFIILGFGGSLYWALLGFRKP